MKPTYISRMFGRLQAVVLLFGLAAAPNLTAQEEAGPGCSNTLLKGWYGGGMKGYEVQAPTGDVGNFPTSGVIAFHADGEGTITEFRRVSTIHGPDPIGFVALPGNFADTAASAMQYTVGPNCIGRMSWIDTVQGPIRLPFVLVNGGREGWTVRSAPPGVILITFKQMEPLDRQIQTRVDEINALLRKIGSRLGLPLDLSAPR